MSDQANDSDKSFDPTPQKLEKSRKKGEIPRSTDLSVAAGYFGLLIGITSLGADAVQSLFAALQAIIEQADSLSAIVLSAHNQAPLAQIMAATIWPVLPLLAVPALIVVLSIFAQRGFLFTLSKIVPKASRISLISNAKNKFGRSGLFEFSKSFSKLIVYAVCLALFLRAKLPQIVAAAQTSPQESVLLLARLCTEFLLLVVLISAVIGGIDALWQHKEHIRKNRMSRKEMIDENKESEGDPYLRQERRQRGQRIAMNQMMKDVATADVVIVNPKHYAVALKWDRTPGTAPTCVAKGVDETAARIREIAMNSAVPIHSDPATARALHATVELGCEVSKEHYAAVAIAIRFAEAMRKRAKVSIK